jgi:type I restriction enzyme M protein
LGKFINSSKRRLIYEYSSSTIVQRLWNYCNVLRDNGMSYSDYVEQLTYLLFLKMDHENSTMLG